MFAQTQLKSFWFRFFQKANRFSGRRPEALSAESETLLSFVKRRRGWISLRSKGRGRTLVGGSPLFEVGLRNKTKREDNILPYIIFTISANIVRCLIIKLIFILPLFLLTQEAQKKKLCKKKSAVFLCRFLKKAPQKLSLLALCKMYKVPDRFVWAICVR